MQPLLFNQWREGISYTNCHLKCVFKAPKVSILSRAKPFRRVLEINLLRSVILPQGKSIIPCVKHPLDECPVY